MTPTEIQDNNRLVAEFMGVKIGEETYSWRIGNLEPLQEKHLAYNREWGWLMPVVERIEKLGKFHVIINAQSISIIDYTSSSEFGQDICYIAYKVNYKMRAIYVAVIEFIK